MKPSIHALEVQLDSYKEMKEKYGYKLSSDSMEWMNEQIESHTKAIQVLKNHEQSLNFMKD